MGEARTRPRPAERGAAGQGSTQYLTFFVDGRRYGVAVPHLLGITGVPPLTPVPGAPAFMRGVINLHGDMVPVVDLRARLGAAGSELTPRSCVILVETNGVAGEPMALVGMLVDEVTEILDVPPHHLRRGPAAGTGIRPDFIQSVGRMGGQPLVLLEVGRVLSLQELNGARRLAGFAGFPRPAPVGATSARA